MTKANDASDLSLSIEKSALKALYIPRPWLLSFCLMVEWIVIIAVYVISFYYWNVLFYFIAVIIIGSRMHALAVLMHDVAHHRFFKNRRLSDFIANVMVCWPLMITVEMYRNNHLSHHQHLNSDLDPDWVAKIGRQEFKFPQTKLGFVLTLLGYMSGIKGLYDLTWMISRMKGKSKKKGVDWNRIGFLVILVTLISVLGGWKLYLLFWVIPFFTSFLLFQYIRSFAEHFGKLEYNSLLGSSRTVLPTLFERVLIAPYNISYHLEHHLYPGIPFHNLPALRDLLLKDSLYQKSGHVTKGYFSGLMQELS